MKHNGPRWLSLTGSGPNTNSSQLYIAFTNTPWLDGLHTMSDTIFVGMDVLGAVEKDHTARRARPVKTAPIASSGSSPTHKPIVVSNNK